MPVIELRGDRVAGNNSIIARPDGSFFDFNGSINYKDPEDLLKAHSELIAGSGDYIPPNAGGLSKHD